MKKMIAQACEDCREVATRVAVIWLFVNFVAAMIMLNTVALSEIRGINIVLVVIAGYACIMGAVFIAHLISHYSDSRRPK